MYIAKACIYVFSKSNCVCVSVSVSVSVSVCVYRRFYTCVLIYRYTHTYIHRSVELVEGVGVSENGGVVCVCGRDRNFVSSASLTAASCLSRRGRKRERRSVFFLLLLCIFRCIFRCRSRTAERRDILTRTLILYLIYYTTASARVRMAHLQLLCSKLGTKSIAN